MHVRDSSRNGTLAGSIFLHNSAREVPLTTPLTVGEYTPSLSSRGEQPALPPHPTEALVAPQPAPVAPAEQSASDRARELASEERERDALALRRDIHRLLLEHLDLATDLVRAPRLMTPYAGERPGPR